MKAIVANYRGSRRRKRGNYLLLSLPTITSKEKAVALVGKTVRWTSPGKNKTTITGTITAPHGGKGIVRARFERGLPGQSLGQEVIVE